MNRAAAPIVPHRPDLAGAALEGLLRGLLAAESGYVEERGANAYLTTVAQLLRQAVAAETVAFGDLVWGLDGSGRPSELRGAAPPHAVGVLDCDALTTLLTRHAAGLRQREIIVLERDTVRRLTGQDTGGRLIPIPFRGATIGLCLLTGGEASLRAGRGACDLVLEAVGNVMQLHRRTAGDRSSLSSQMRTATRWQRAAALLADAVWEARDDGRIDLFTPLGDQVPGAVRSAVLGSPQALRLSGDLTLGELLAQQDECRHLPATIATADGPVACWVSVQRQPDGRVLGALGLDDGSAAEAEMQPALVEMIHRLERGRSREHQLRTEAETLLQGLHILTGAATSAGMFEDLLALLQMSIGFESACLIKRDWQGRLSAFVSTDPALDGVNWQSLGPLLGTLGDTPCTVPPDHPLAQRLREAADRGWGSMVVAPLALGHETAWLLYLHSGHNAFRPQHLNLIGSLALLTTQALASEDQRAQVIQAGKLAALGQMSAGIAHEINQPLNAIALAAQNLDLMLERADVEPSALARKIKRILDQVHRAHAITKKMRSFSRKSPGMCEAFLPLEHIDNAISLVEARLNRHGVALRLVDAELAPFCLGDATQFEQVVVNILSNAIDAILQRHHDDPAAPAAAIEVTFVPLENYRLDIIFRDSGPGFDQAALANAFTPFFTTKEVGKGTGLGLSISYSIMANMGGALRVGNWENGAEVVVTVQTTT